MILRVPLERTIAENRGVILARSREMLDIFGQTIDYEIPRKIRELVHYGDQTFAFTSDAASTRAASRLVHRARRMRVDVLIAYTDDQFDDLRKRWRV